MHQIILRSSASAVLIVFRCVFHTSMAEITQKPSSRRAEAESPCFFTVSDKKTPFLRDFPPL